MAAQDYDMPPPDTSGYLAANDDLERKFVWEGGDCPPESCRVVVPILPMHPSGAALSELSMIGQLRKLLTALRAYLSGAGGIAGLTAEAAEAAFAGMRGGGGHAMRKLIAEGLIPNAGTLASRVQAMKTLLLPILRTPAHRFAWRVGTTQAMGFIGKAAGRDVFVFIATEGAYAGRVISSGVVAASDWGLWGLVP